MNVAATLRRAKEEIKVRGWCKRVPLDEDGRVCAIGALWFASGGKEDDDWDREAHYSFLDYIHKAVRDNEAAIYLGQNLYPDTTVPSNFATSRVWWWNDDAHDVAEILEGLETVAQKWESENA